MIFTEIDRKKKGERQREKERYSERLREIARD